MIIKRIFFISILLLIVKLSYCQKISKWECGIETGPNFSSLRGNEIINKYQKTKIGYSGGLFIQYNFKKLISLHLSLTYENKGSKNEGQAFDILGNPIGIGKGRTIAQYLNIPLLVRASFGKKRIFFVNTGPYIGYRIKIQDKADNNLYLERDITNQFKKIDFGISFGLGASLPITNQFNLSVEARDNLGLSNISAVPVYNNGTVKNNAASILVGLYYKLNQSH